MEHLAVVLWLHGGGWHSRASGTGATLAEHGLLVVQGTYRLTGQARWPAQLADVRAAARQARKQAGGLPLIVAGESAGGHLALHLGLRCVDRPGDVAAVMAFWAPADPLAPDWLQARRDDNPWEGLLGHPPAEGDAATRDAAPIQQVGNGVPVLLVHGCEDRALPPTQTTALTAALIAAGHPVHSLITHGGHGIDLQREDIRAVVRAFLASALPAGLGAYLRARPTIEGDLDIMRRGDVPREIGLAT